MTKHELILKYISELAIGEKVSVRGIAKAMTVSEGTAYHAIKDAELKGLVVTIDRVGTIRIKRKQREQIEKLTFAEVTKIINGQVIGGKSGLHKRLNKFLIGAMEIVEMTSYIDAGDLLIVGNRKDAQERALNMGAAVLVTGGFAIPEKIQNLANTLGQPLILTNHDTFTVAQMINQASFDQRIKSGILLVEDIVDVNIENCFLFAKDPIAKWHELNIATQRSRFPVVDENIRTIGVVTTKDILGKPFDLSIEQVMSKKPITVMPQTSVAAAAHLMVREAIEILPVVDEKNRLIGLLHRADLNQALQHSQLQRQTASTLDQLIAQHLIYEKSHSSTGENFYKIDVTPQMINHQGMLSYGVFTTIVTEVARLVFYELGFPHLIVENIMIYFLKNTLLGPQLEIYPNIFEIGRNSGKIDIIVKSEHETMGKSVLACQVLKK